MPSNRSRAASTLVAVVGADATIAVRTVAAAADNVSAETVGEVPSDPVAAMPLLIEAWRRAGTHGPVYTLVDADPLQPVVAQWAARLASEEHHLETAIGLVGDAVLPDHYLVSPDLPEPGLHWYLGLLAEMAPSRVVPVTVEVGPLLATLAALPYGRALPPAADLAARARDYVPLPSIAVVGGRTGSRLPAR